MKEQSRNRRNNRIIEYNGEVHCVAEWGDLLGIDDYLIRNRLHNGYSNYEALSKNIKRR